MIGQCQLGQEDIIGNLQDVPGCGRLCSLYGAPHASPHACRREGTPSDPINSPLASSDTTLSVLGAFGLFFYLDLMRYGSPTMAGPGIVIPHSVIMFHDL